MKLNITEETIFRFGFCNNNIHSPTNVFYTGQSEFCLFFFLIVFYKNTVIRIRTSK